MNKVLKMYASRRMLVSLLLGFSSGLPFGLTGSSLQAWMTDEKVDLTVIGIFALVGLPYTFKFLWAPLLDSFDPPAIFGKLGRRRGWILFAQACLMAMIALMSLTPPAAAPFMLALFAVGVAFSSASQDIVVDAYRAELLPPIELGAGTGVAITGYRIALIVSGALALVLADHLPWPVVYLIMASAIGLGMVGTLIGPEPKLKDGRIEAKNPWIRIQEGAIGPFRDFFGRKGAIEILVFLLLYKLGDVVASAMITPFLLQTGFTKTDIGAVYKVFGMIATIIGGLAGGALMLRLGLRGSLLLFGLMQAATNVLFAFLAQAGANYPLLVSTVFMENLAGGMGTAAYAAFMMTLCRARFTASQYALLSSIMAVTRVIASTPTGYMAQNFGWPTYFWVSMLLAVPGLVMLVRFPSWEKIR
jgi:PAT family beta-lactamase induction signal transducer AmpG